MVHPGPPDMGPGHQSLDVAPRQRAPGSPGRRQRVGQASGIEGLDPVGTEPPADHRAQRAEVVTEVGGPPAPLGPQGLDGGGPVLGRPGGEEGDRTRTAPGSPPEVLGDAGPTHGEQVPEGRVHAHHVTHAPFGDFPARPQPVGQLPAQVGPVELAGRPHVAEQPPAVHRRPGPVHAPGHVGHHHVGMEVGVEGPAGAVEERPGGHPRRRQQPHLAAGRTAHTDGPPRQVPGRRLHRGGVPAAGCLGHLAGRQGLEKADRLGRGEGEVVGGHPHPGPGLGRAELRARPGVASGQYGGEGRAVDLPDQSQVHGPGTGPDPRSLTGQQRPLGPTGHQVVHVVAVTSEADGVHGQHGGGTIGSS